MDDFGEPWGCLWPGAIFTRVPGQAALASKERRERVLATINACAGMADPAAELAELRAEVERLREALGFIAGRLEDSYMGLPTSTFPGPPASLITRAREALERKDG